MTMAGLVIEQEVVIAAPAEVVWRTITEPDQMRQWFADRVDLIVEPEPRSSGPRSQNWREAFLMVPRTLIVRARKEGN